MSVNSISQDLTALKIHSVPNTANYSGKTSTGSTLTTDQVSTNQAMQASSSSPVESLQKNAALTQNKPSSDVTTSTQKKPDRAMSHVVETYNQQGELLLKFMDSNNNLLYQLPSEMEAKMKEQMSQQETSTSTIG